jgi:RNA polymerase sigma factor (sigma-70 family)
MPSDQRGERRIDPKDDRSPSRDDVRSDFDAFVASFFAAPREAPHDAVCCVCEEVMRIAKRICWRLGLSSRAEDVAQNVQERLLRLADLNRIQVKPPFRGYISQIVINAARDETRRQSRYSARVALGDDEDQESARAQELGPEGIAQLTELEMCVEEELAQLPDMQRAVMTLVRQGLSSLEIQERLDLLPDSLRGIMARSRSRLRERLQRRWA